MERRSTPPGTPRTAGTSPSSKCPPTGVDNVAVAGTAVSDGSSLDGWQSATQVRPTPVHGFTVQLLAYKANGRSAVRIANLRLNRNFGARASDDKLEDLLGENQADFVGAIVTYDEPTESITDYAPYSLTVETDNGRGDDDDDDDD